MTAAVFFQNSSVMVLKWFCGWWPRFQFSGISDSDFNLTMALSRVFTQFTKCQFQGSSIPVLTMYKMFHTCSQCTQNTLQYPQYISILYHSLIQSLLSYSIASLFSYSIASLFFYSIASLFSYSITILFLSLFSCRICTTSFHIPYLPSMESEHCRVGEFQMACALTWFFSTCLHIHPEFQYK